MVSERASDTHDGPLRVLIAGGGVAALETLLALRALAGDRVAPMMFAPDPSFHYRPLSVTEPFGRAIARNLDLAEVALEHGATFLRDGLAEVDTTQRVATTTGGRELDYDVLVIAIGARGADGIKGALTFHDSFDGGTYAEVLKRLEQGDLKRLAFVVPDGVAWPLGLYELALLTSARLHELGIEDCELALVTPEASPLSVFGAKASNAVKAILEEAGIELWLKRRSTDFYDGELRIADEQPLACECAVALPVPEVVPIGGLAQDDRGFLAVDRYGGVLGAEAVFAVGDVTTFPIKQGGVATQAADSAASAIAAVAGAEIDPQQFQPVLRGALLTEWGPRYLRAKTTALTGEASKSVLWWPPAKIAGRYIAPYLAGKAGYKLPGRLLTDLQPPQGDDPADLKHGHEDVFDMALVSADLNAGARDYGRALGWLEIAEDLELYLPREYELRRASWQELANRARQAGHG
ncbi:hypothetical protein BH10ACT11_BH10ACT11_06630 [soil metagenome]